MLQVKHSFLDAAAVEHDLSGSADRSVISLGTSQSQTKSTRRVLRIAQSSKEFVGPIDPLIASMIKSLGQMTI